MKNGNPQELIKDVMNSDSFKQSEEIGKKIEDALNIVLEQQHIINDNLLTFVDYFKEINNRLEYIEKRLNRTEWNL